MTIIDAGCIPMIGTIPAGVRAHRLPSTSGEEIVAAMDSVGIYGAITVSLRGVYRYGPGYALEA
jgi:hypothetical protein